MKERLALLVTVAAGQATEKVRAARPRQVLGAKVFTLENQGVKMFFSHRDTSLLVSDLCPVHNRLVCNTQRAGYLVGLERNIK